MNAISQGAETFTYSNDTLSRRASLERPNGVTTIYSYDQVSRLTRLLHSNAQSQTIQDFNYTYNVDDQIDSITSLFSAQLLSSAATAGAADAANRIAQFGGTNITFDSTGQTTTKTDGQGTTTYEWDARGRMTRATLPNAQQVSYAYDALGRRASRTASGVTTSFLYDGLDVVLDQGSDSGLVDYINGAGIDEKLRQSSATASLYFLQDHLGSTAALLDANGGVAERLDYEAFGQSASSALSRFGYAGREREGQTGLMYYRARWYDPGQGRFISEDPIGCLGGVDFYAYVENDPVNWTDPLGLQTGQMYWDGVRWQVCTCEQQKAANKALATEYKAILDAYDEGLRQRSGPYKFLQWTSPLASASSAVVGMQAGYKAGGILGALKGSVKGVFGGGTKVLGAAIADYNIGTALIPVYDATIGMEAWLRERVDQANKDKKLSRCSTGQVELSFFQVPWTSGNYGKVEAVVRAHRLR